jgi:chlorite dismutase
MAVSSLQEAFERARAFPAGLDFVAWTAYRATGTPTALPREDRQELSAQALSALTSHRQVALRGTYDTSGYRAGAHLMIWTAASSPDLLQNSLAAFGQSPLALALEPVWASIGVHRPADFAKAATPAYYRGENPRRYLSVCPVAHSLEYHAMDAHDRRRLLIDADRVVRGFPDVRANPVAAFGLGEHEAIVAFESDDLLRIVDLLRDLRAIDAQRYRGDAIPFITGVRKPLGEIIESLP